MNAKELIKKAMREHGEPMSRKQIVVATSLSDSIVRSAIEDFVASGEVRIAGVEPATGRKGPRSYLFELVDKRQHRTLTERVTALEAQVAQLLRRVSA